VFVEHPEAPMDNNLGENSIRTPVMACSLCTSCSTL
jgi:hypothetical protein